MKFLRKKIVKEGFSDDAAHHGGLSKVLSVRDLTFFGIAAIIGAGIFSSIGSACASGGPGVIFLFIICAVACGFTAMCYAEFASRVPVSGSAYTYAYVSFGELFAWIIGWALLMEYSIGNIYVAFSWSGYFTNLLEAVHIHFPEWLTSNYMESKQAFLNATDFSSGYKSYLAGKTTDVTEFFSDWMKGGEIKEAMNKGVPIADLYGKELGSLTKSEEYLSWMRAPRIGGLRIILDLPAILINIIITWLVLVGVKESKNASNLMVIIKLAILVLIIIVGAFYIDIDNWSPFMPKGFTGVMAGVSSVFFAFIGFDAVSTLAEECKNPQRDLPRGMIYSLVISTVIFVILALVLTGMAVYSTLDVPDPLADIFKQKGVKWMLYIVSFSAVVAMTSVILVFQMGQPRIWMTMSRDGLLPAKFASIHPKYKTPGFSTIMTGLVVGVPIFFTDRQFVLDFTSIGTLFAFVLVCGGILVIPRRTREKGKFNLPYANSAFIFPPLLIAIFCYLFFGTNYFTDLANFDFSGNAEYLAGKKSFMDVAMVQIASFIFWGVCAILAILSVIKKYSLIPLLGLVSCLYLLTGMTKDNWAWFLVWLAVGLVVYFLYGYKKSKLAGQPNS